MGVTKSFAQRPASLAEAAAPNRRSNPPTAERRRGAAECRQAHIHSMQNNSSHPIGLQEIRGGYTNQVFNQLKVKIAGGSGVHV
jgi:hypothetical protein